MSKRELSEADVETLYQTFLGILPDEPSHRPMRDLLDRLGRLEKPRLAPGVQLLAWAHGAGPDLRLLVGSLERNEFMWAVEELIDVAMNLLEFEARLRNAEGCDAAAAVLARTQVRRWADKLRATLGPVEMPYDRIRSTLDPEPSIDPNPTLDPQPMMKDSFEERVRASRRKAGKTMLDMSVALECGTVFWSAVENGEQVPSLRQMQQIVRTLEPADSAAADRLWTYLMAAYPVQVGTENALRAQQVADAERVHELASRAKFESTAALGPDSFGGEDYPASSAVDLSQDSSPLAEVPEPALFSLGHLEGLLNEQEAALARRITRVTGWVPVVRLSRNANGRVQACSVVYQFVPQWDEERAPRTQTVIAPEKIAHNEKLLWALREVSRLVSLDHRRDV